MDSQRGTCTVCHHTFRLRGSAQESKCPKCGGTVVAEPEAAAHAPKPERRSRPVRASTEASGTTSRTSRTRSPAEEKKPSRLPLIIGAAVVVVLAIWFVASRGKEE